MVELARAREVHPAKQRRVSDEVTSLMGMQERNSERYNAAMAALVSTHIQIDKVNLLNKRLETEDGAAHEELVRRISELDRTNRRNKRLAAKNGATRKELVHHISELEPIEADFKNIEQLANEKIRFHYNFGL